MPVLRLFAAAREAAGTATAEVPGATVDEVLAAARARFGPEFAAVLDASRVWRNGEPARADDPVAGDDEVAVLPPVSGGSDGPRRPRFAPAEPPPSEDGPRRPRRSPAADQIAERRQVEADRRATGRSAPGAGQSGAGRDGAGRDGAGRDGGGRRGAGHPRDGRAGDGRAGDGRTRDARSGAGRPRSGAAGRTAAEPRHGTDAPGSRRGTDAPGSRRGTDAPPVSLPPGLRGERARSRPDDAARGADADRGADAVRPGEGLRAGRRPAVARAGGVRVRGDKVPRPKPVVDRPPPRIAAPTPPPIEPGELTRVPTVTGAPIAPPADGAPDATDAPRKAGAFTRMRSVGVPVTGHVTIRGKERKVSGTRTRRTAFGQRYGIVYDLDGPKVTLGVAWFVAVLGGIFVGWWVLTFVVAVVAGWAALEASLRWREQGVAADPLVAGLGAAVVAGAGAAGARWVGAAILLVVAAAVAHVAFGPTGREHTLSAAGNTVGCAIPFGLAAASIVLTNDLEIGAAAVLVVLVSAYEAGDFLIGSGASNPIEGPITGMVSVGVVATTVAVLEVTPFDGTAVFPFAAFAAFACVAGQLAASAILPAADAHAPSVRRLDSYLLLAPAWVWAVGLFVQS